MGPQVLKVLVFLAGAVAAPPADSAAIHAQLARFSGTWSVTQSFWSAPNAAAVIDQGRARFTMVLAARHLREELTIASKTPFEALSYIGYDDKTGRYFSTWMDVNFNGLILAEGSYDAASRSYVFRGKMATGPDPSKAVPVREVLTVSDDNHFTYDFFEQHAGKDMHVVRLTYARSP